MSKFVSMVALEFDCHVFLVRLVHIVRPAYYFLVLLGLFGLLDLLDLHGFLGFVGYLGRRNPQHLLQLECGTIKPQPSEMFPRKESELFREHESTQSPFVREKRIV